MFRCFSGIYKTIEARVAHKDSSNISWPTGDKIIGIIFHITGPSPAPWANGRWLLLTTWPASWGQWCRGGADLVTGVSYNKPRAEGREHVTNMQSYKQLHYTAIIPGSQDKSIFFLLFQWHDAFKYSINENLDLTAPGKMKKDNM